MCPSVDNPGAAPLIADVTSVVQKVEHYDANILQPQDPLHLLDLGHGGGCRHAQRRSLLDSLASQHFRGSSHVGSKILITFLKKRLH